MGSCVARGEDAIGIVLGPRTRSTRFDDALAAPVEDEEDKEDTVKLLAVPLMIRSLFLKVLHVQVIPA